MNKLQVEMVKAVKQVTKAVQKLVPECTNVNLEFNQSLKFSYMHVWCGDRHHGCIALRVKTPKQVIEKFKLAYTDGTLTR